MWQAFSLLWRLSLPNTIIADLFCRTQNVSHHDNVRADNIMNDLPC